MSIPYLDVVVHGQVADGLGVRPPVLAVGVEGLEAVAGVGVQHLLEDDHVLHALKNERLGE